MDAGVLYASQCVTQYASVSKERTSSGKVFYLEGIGPINGCKVFSDIAGQGIVGLSAVGNQVGMLKI
jgi:hypothetical protein